jgi:hypothetical protein
MLAFISRMVAAARGPAPAEEVKASATSPQVYSLYAGQEAWGVYPKRNPAQYSDEAYRRNSVAFMCVNLLARSCAAIPWKVVRGADANGRGGEEVEDSHPLAVLLRLPNPTQSGRTLREAIVAYYSLSGNAYVEAVGPDGKPPQELHPLRPDRMRVKPGPILAPTSRWKFGSTAGQTANGLWSVAASTALIVKSSSSVRRIHISWSGVSCFMTSAGAVITSAANRPIFFLRRRSKCSVLPRYRTLPNRLILGGTGNSSSRRTRSRSVTIPRTFLS